MKKIDCLLNIINQCLIGITITISLLAVGFNISKSLIVILWGITFYFLPNYEILRFLLNPIRYDKFASMKEENSSSTDLLTILSVIFIIFFGLNNYSIFHLVVSMFVVVIIAILLTKYLHNKIPNSHVRNSRLFIGLYYGFCIYPIVFLHSLI